MQIDFYLGLGHHKTINCHRRRRPGYRVSLRLFWFVCTIERAFEDVLAQMSIAASAFAVRPSRI